LFKHTTMLLRSIVLSAVLLTAHAHASVKLSAAAPDFTLKSASGPNLRLAEQRGQVVMVNFWATWCGPCRVELPHLSRLHDTYKKAGFAVLGVNIDNNPQQAIDLAQRLGVSFPVLLDTNKAVVTAYDLRDMPATVLIDRDGRVRHIYRGYKDGAEQTYEQHLRALLKE
jgi:peroxiredoxin